MIWVNNFIKNEYNNSESKFEKTHKKYEKHNYNCILMCFVL